MLITKLELSKLYKPKNITLFIKMVIKKKRKTGKKKRKPKSKLKIGLALGGGGAKGLAHIGVLKILHKHKIYPDYIAGTSMGSIIGALYSSGYSPNNMEEVAKTTNWKEIIDFTVPKSGLLEGLKAEKKIRKLIDNKKFADLNIPLQVTSYNFNKKEKVIFSEGDVTKAVRASMAIPGIFTPVKIGAYSYIDGAVADPTPYDVVKKMGADIVIAVDLYVKQKTISGPIVKKDGLLSELKEQFIVEELLNLKNYIFPQRWPRFIRKILIWGFDKLLYPAKVIKILAGKEMPQITRIMYETVNILTNNLAQERFNNAAIDIKVTPVFDGITWSDFQMSKKIIQLGETAMKKKVVLLKKKLGRT